MEQFTTSQAEMQQIFLPKLLSDGSKFKKFRNVFARPAVAGEKIETFTSDGKETECVAQEGDYVIQSQTEAREEYLLSKEKFQKRYVRANNLPFKDGFSEHVWCDYKPIGTVVAIEFHPFEAEMSDPLYFEAPWLESMVLKKGDMIATQDGKEIYRIARKEFEQTYRIEETNE